MISQIDVAEREEIKDIIRNQTDIVSTGKNTQSDTNE